MKKLFSLALVFFTMLFAANAQVPILTENFDSGMPTGWTQIDANNDGYGWEHCSAPVSYFAAGADLSGSGHNSSTGFVLSGSYSNVTSTAITPDNWLITPQTAIPSQGATLTFWVCAQDASYPAEHYGVYISTTTATATTSFTQLMEETIDANGGTRVQGAWKQKTVSLAAYAGQTVYIAFRHFNCNDQFVLNLDDVEISAAPSTPTIVANPTTINFNSVLLNDTATEQVSIAGYALTTGITATATSPFEVSADGTTFGSTATLAQAGGTLYVQYAPTASTTDNGTVTLSSTGAPDVTITVSGTGLDCGNVTIPFTEGFESTIDCWTMVSMNPANDDRFGIYEDQNAYAGSYDFRFSSFSSATDYNQYLITPELNLTGTGTYTIQFYYKGYNANENFKVLYSTTTNAISSFTMLADYTNVATSWTQTALELPAGTKYVAINYYGNYQYYLYVDNITVSALSAPDVTVSGPTALESGEAGTFTATSPLADSFAWVIDGVATTDTTNVITHTFTTAGIHNVKVIATNAIGSGADSMDVEVYVCDPITQFPLTEGFENGLRCWSMVSIDPTNDGSFGIINNASYVYNGSKAFMFSSYTSASDYNQYLITPELQLPTGANYMFSFYYMGYDSEDNFKVLYSTTTNDITSFTELADYQNVATDWTEASVALPAGTKYVAINYYGNYAYYLFVDDINIDELSAPTVTITGPTTAETGTAVEFTANSPLAQTYAWTVDGAAVSSTTSTLSHTFTTTGNHTVGVTVTNTAGTATATHTVNVISCDGARTLPFSEDFNNGIPPLCWTYNDAESFGEATVDDAGDYALYFEYLDMLVTPELASSNPMQVTFGYRGYLGPYGETPTSFRVGYSSTSNSASSFTWLPSVSITDYPADEEGLFFTYNANVPAGTKYIAIEAVELGTYGSYEDVIYIDNFLVTEGQVSVNEYNDNVNVYPNPANNVVNVNAASNINNVEIFNMMGQKVAAFDANDTNVQINTTALSNGMYMMRITTENGVSNQKFTVAR